MKIKLFMGKIKKISLWLLWDFSGLRYIWSKIVPPMPDREKQQRRPSTFILWVVGIYIALFGVASNRYENRVDIIENRINGIYAQLSKDEQIAFERISYVQHLACPYKPNLFIPLSVIKSFFVNAIYEDGAEQLKELFEDYFKKIREISDENEKKKRVSKLLGYYLGGIYLNNANLWGANLENAKLMQANLENAKLMQANLENAFLNEANLENATLVTTNLKNAYLEGANLENATLKEANLEKAYLEGANLENATLKEANLEKAYLEGANLENAWLWKANLENANFNEANLENAWLEKANLENALLCNANLKNIRDITAERLSKAFSLWGVKNLDPELKQEVEKINPKLFEPNYEIKECNDKGKGSYWLEYLEQQKNKK